MKELENILRAFVNRYPRLGYYSGMSFAAGHILRYLTEEESFWAFCIFNRQILTLNYYPTFIGEQIIYHLFDDIFKQAIPDLYAYFVEQDIEHLVFTSSWFVSQFSWKLPVPVSEQILELLFLCGPKILFRGALAVLLLNKEKMMTLDLTGVFMVLLL
eukprot:TRINITY_DN10987_c0_g1_i2.p1 TRINITY_DN10987_c0_g1~~TRINITY_DN10987_c0_g1_i2.p1  ORF type:complete len:158 (-),score=17.89 TRINITY_DN10987_c0_g1_i2:243-716(-)